MHFHQNILGGKGVGGTAAVGWRAAESVRHVKSVKKKSLPEELFAAALQKKVCRNYLQETGNKTE